MSTIIDKLKGALVVSCQAPPGDPLENTDALRRMALASIRGGAGGLRLNSGECIAAIRRDTGLPIIGLKKRYLDGRLRITPDFEAAVELAEAGADIIALDCTDRLWPSGDPWRELVARIHNELRLPVMADIATLEEALAAAAADADMIGTTLHGYTEQTQKEQRFSWRLLASIVEQTGRPVIAEGRISTPQEAKRAIETGAWCVVVGSAITRPGAITASFVQSIKRSLAPGQVVAVDIGGTSIKGGLVSHAGQIGTPFRIPTPASGGRDAIASATAEVIHYVLSAARRAEIEPVGLGIATAGMIDARSGTVFAATENLPGWSGFALREFAEKRFQLPTHIESDGHAAALAEMRFGKGLQFNNFVAITIGTGLGGGIVLNRKLIRGQNGFAGTFGHSVIRQNGRNCTCGRTGCLEAYVSASALAREYRELKKAPSEEAEVDDAAAAFRIGKLASAKESIALQAYSMLARYLAEGIANLFNVLDPEVVLVSGGIVEGYPDFAAEVEQRVSQLLHFGGLRRPRVQLASCGYEASILGAAAAVFDPQED